MTIKKDGDIKTVETVNFILDRYLDFDCFVLTDKRSEIELKIMTKDIVKELYYALRELLKD